MSGNGLLESLEELYNFLFYGLGIAELGIAGTILVVCIIAGLVAAVFAFLVSLLVFVLEAIPLFKISKKVGRSSAWLVWLSWLPIVGNYLSTYVLSDVLGNKPLKLVDKFIIENRLLSFWIYVGINLFGSSLITAFIGMVNVIPFVGQVIGACSTLLYLLPMIATAWIEYAYLRDVLNLFKPDQKSNNTTAIVIAILDALVTFGFARAFYLYTVMNKEPLPSQTENPQ